MPTELTVSSGDDAVETVRLLADMWNLGKVFVCHVPNARRVRKVAVDPRRVLPDFSRTNNAWVRR